jgi:hypothetical protein
MPLALPAELKNADRRSVSLRFEATFMRFSNVLPRSDGRLCPQLVMLVQRDMPTTLRRPPFSANLPTSVRMHSSSTSDGSGRRQRVKHFFAKVVGVRTWKSSTTPNNLFVRIVDLISCHGFKTAAAAARNILHQRFIVELASFDQFPLPFVTTAPRRCCGCCPENATHS